MSNEKCCKNCVDFCNEGVNETGLCCKSLVRKITTYSYNCCVAHEWKLPKWTEITPDNVDEVDLLRKDRFIDILDSRTMIVKNVDDYHCSLTTMAELGGYYYYVLPELKIE